VVPLKNRCGIGLKLKIDDVDGGKMSGSEIFDQIGLSYLTSS
jgi:hypothetical protein